ncbi:hypothetical protein [Selenihalanaerobacter shriftii]|uniref:Uncharacterized protein n=1 Tax=Selenihalanaerobacter shriftii TaxID=142842 RepID=A0A1T4JQS1_9FIRM|nr:hypothetical protein [Selenihalanaerobacter shriftii]SJZ32493.1 hypothetical protein SAMN02745118_00331 [Selenihalanaerobacter shriftii]
MFNNASLKIILVALLLITIGSLSIYSPIIQAGDIGEQFLKLFGVGFVVDKFAKPLNSFINTLTLNNGVQIKNATKVVPIVTVGSGSYVGAVQVSGPSEQVAKVKAVAQLEGDFKDGSFRIKALVPVNTKNPLNQIDRIEGVGITALIDIGI